MFVIMFELLLHLASNTYSWPVQMKGPVEKGRKWRFGVKIEIAPI